MSKTFFEVRKDDQWKECEFDLSLFPFANKKEEWKWLESHYGYENVRLVTICE